MGVDVRVSVAAIVTIGLATTAVACASASPSLSAGSAVFLVRTPPGSPAAGATSSGADEVIAGQIPLDDRFHPLAVRLVPALRARDTAIALADVELTDDIDGPTGHHVDLIATLAVGTSSSPSDASAHWMWSSGPFVITWREHHAIETVHASWRVGDSRSRFVILAVRVRALSAAQACDGVPVPSCAVTANIPDSQLEVLRIPTLAASPHLEPRTAPIADQIDAPLAIEPGYGRKTNIWQSPAFKVKAGEVIEAAASLQLDAHRMMEGLPPPGATTPGCVGMFSGGLYLTSSSDPTELLPITGDHGFNLNQLNPSEVWTGDGAAVVPQGWSTVTVVMQGWAARGVKDSTCTGRTLDIVGSRSQLNVVRYSSSSVRDAHVAVTERHETSYVSSPAPSRPFVAAAIQLPRQASGIVFATLADQLLQPCEGSVQTAVVVAGSPTATTGSVIGTAELESVGTQEPAYSITRTGVVLVRPGRHQPKWANLVVRTDGCRGVTAARSTGTASLTAFSGA